MQPLRLLMSAILWWHLLWHVVKVIRFSDFSLNNGARFCERYLLLNTALVMFSSNCPCEAILVSNHNIPNFSCWNKRNTCMSFGYHCCFELLYAFSQVSWYQIYRTRLSKLCRPRSDATKCGIWLGSTLVVSYPAFNRHINTQGLKLTCCSFRILQRNC